ARSRARELPSGRRRARACQRRSCQRQRLAVEILGALDLDEDREALLVRVALLLGLDEAPPDLLVRRARLVDLGGAVEARDAILGQHAGLAKLGFSQEDRHPGLVTQVAARRAL